MIYTFYSYKGGVGRSMALANVASLLYQAGLRVLMVDWDLEAPGLDRFFTTADPPKAGDCGSELPPIEEVLDAPGLIDLLTEYRDTLSRSPGLWRQMAQYSPAGTDDQTLSDTGWTGGPIPPPGATPHAADPDAERALFERAVPGGLRQYIIDLCGQPADPAWLGFLPAGRRAGEHLRRYAEKTRNFSWAAFYERWAGARFFEWFRREVNDLADAVLIDSRTGVTEMGGVCVYHLADAVVILCAPNHQNLVGSAQIADDIRDSADRGELKPYRGDRPIRVLVVPSRVEDRAETTQAAEFVQRFVAAVGRHLPAELETAFNSVWDLGIPYVPYYAFLEHVPVRDVVDAPGRTNLVDAYVRLVGVLARLYQEPALADGPDEPRTPAGTATDIRLLIHAAPEDDLWADLLADVLAAFDLIKPDDEGLRRQAEKLSRPSRVYRGFRELIDEAFEGWRQRKDAFRAIARVVDRSVVTHVIVLLSEHYFRRYGQWDPLAWAHAQPHLRRLVEDDDRLSDDAGINRAINPRRVHPILIGDSHEAVPELFRQYRRTVWRAPADVERTAIGVLSRFPLLGAGNLTAPEAERQADWFDRSAARPGQDVQRLTEGDTLVIREDTRVTKADGLDPDQIRVRLEQVKTRLGWANTTGSARKWWEVFEDENRHRTDQVLRLAEELVVRKATITEFFLAYVYSNTHNIQANLYYLDYTRLKKEEDRRKQQEWERQEEARYAAHKARLGYDGAPEAVRRWWDVLEQENRAEVRWAAAELAELEVRLSDALTRWEVENGPRLTQLVDHYKRTQDPEAASNRTRLELIRCPFCGAVMPETDAVCRICGKAH